MLNDITKKYITALQVYAGHRNAVTMQ